MLTEDEIVADLARLRERSADIEYAGAVPQTRRSAAATVAPVAALAAVATIGTSLVIGSDEDGRAPGASRGGSVSVDESVASPDVDVPAHSPVELVDAQITLAGKVITYRHPVGDDPFAPGWQLAIVFGDGLPADATEFTLRDGSSIWVSDAPRSDAGETVLIAFSGPDGNTNERIYAGISSEWTRAELEDWVRTELDGHEVSRTTS